MPEQEEILHITNFPVREATDGGSTREKALAEFVSVHDGRRLTVQDEGYWTSKSGHIARLPRLLHQIEQAEPDLVVLDYPSYPFFWQYKVTPFFGLSLIFTQRLRKLADKRGFKVAVDVMDLPVFQYSDLGFSLSMSPSMLQRFDKFIFRRADWLWVCSGSLAKLIHTCYAVDRSKIIVALNGYGPSSPVEQDNTDTGLVRAAYAGSLNHERGIEPLIEGFLSSQESGELHLCGPSGEWIAESYPSSRIVYHGALPDEDASAVLSHCHLGVIPYPERGYYNLAFATKLAFYLGLGLPVLCSNVTETGEYVNSLGVGMCTSISEFPAAFEHIARHPQELKDWRRQVMRVRGLFSWNSIYTLALEESLRRHGVAAA